MIWFTSIRICFPFALLAPSSSYKPVAVNASIGGFYYTVKQESIFFLVWNLFLSSSPPHPFSCCTKIRSLFILTEFYDAFMNSLRVSSFKILFIAFICQTIWVLSVQLIVALSIDILILLTVTSFPIVLRTEDFLHC